MADMDDKAFADVEACEKCKTCVHKPYNECLSGHKYCKSCTQKFGSCSICSGVIYQVTERYEHPMSCAMIHFPCVNYDNDCKFTGNMEDCADHQDICPKRPFKCPFVTVLPLCDFTGPLEKLLDHFQAAHPKDLRWHQPKNMNKPKRDVLVNFIECYEAPFALRPFKAAFQAHSNLFLLNFNMSEGDVELKCNVDVLEYEVNKKEMKFTYQIMFGKVGGSRKGVGDVCGVPSRVALKDLKSLCGKNGDLSFEVEVFDRETQEEGYVVDFT